MPWHALPSDASQTPAPIPIPIPTPPDLRRNRIDPRRSYLFAKFLAALSLPQLCMHRRQRQTWRGMRRVLDASNVGVGRLIPAWGPGLYANTTPLWRRGGRGDLREGDGGNVRRCLFLSSIVHSEEVERPSCTSIRSLVGARVQIECRGAPGLRTMIIIWRN